MKTLFTISFGLLLYVISTPSFGQTRSGVEFGHDVAGNRVLREISVTRVADTSFQNQGDSIVNTLIKTLNQIKVYPNPTFGLINIDVPELINKIEYTLFDEQSKIIKKGYLESQHSIIDISDCQKGIFLLKINYQQTSCTYKIIKS